MGVYNAELFNNLGLCCYYAQQYDMALSCFQHALVLASSDTLADVWYNIGHITMVMWAGLTNCDRMSLTYGIYLKHNLVMYFHHLNLTLYMYI